ncbi:MAG: phage tail tape measure protein [Clostridia bacterium]|nr:phage tail tape measure protein [Clostridia bacterium]
MAVDAGIVLSAGGEKAFKAALSSATSQIKALQSGMDDAVLGMQGLDSAEAKSTKRASLAGKAQDLYRKKIELLTQKHDAESKRLKQLGGDLLVAKVRFGENSAEAEKAAIAYANQEKRVADLDTQLTKTQKELANFQEANSKTADALEDSAKSADETGKATQDMGQKQDEAGGKADGLAGKLNALADVMSVKLVANACKAVADGMMGIAEKIGGVIGKAWDLTAAAAEMADGVSTEAAKLHIGDQLYQELNYAAQQCGVSTESVVTAMQTMEKKVQKPNSATRRAFRQLGISMKDAGGNMKDSETLFNEAVDAIAKIENPAKRDKIALKLFGVSAKDLDGVLRNGSDGFNQFRSDAQELGAVMTGDTVTNLRTFKSQLDAMKTAADGAKNAIAGSLTPAFSPFATAATTAMSDFKAALDSGFTPESVQTLSDNLTTNLTTAVENLALLIQTSTPTLSTALTTVFTALGEQLPGIINTLSPVLSTTFTALFEALGTIVEPLAGVATTILGTLGTKLIESLPTLTEKAVSIISGLVDAITAALPQLIPAAISIITQIATSLIGALPLLIAKIPEIFSAIVEGFAAVDWGSIGKQIMDSIAGAFANIGSTILGWFTGGKKEVEADKTITDYSTTATAIKDSVTGVLKPDGSFLSEGFTAARDAISKIDWGGLGSTISGAFSGAIETVKSIAGGIWGAIQGWFGSDEEGEAKDSGADVLDGIASGLQETGTAEAAASTAGAAIRAAIEGELTFIDGYNVGQAFAGFVSDGFTSKDFTEVGRPIPGFIGSGALSKKGDLTNKMRDLIKAAKDKANNEVGSGGSNFKSIGKNIALGIASGIKSGQIDVTNAISDVIEAAIEKARSSADIGSPSRRFRDEVGVWLSRGIGEGVTRGIADVQSAVGGVIDAAAGMLGGSPALAAAGAGGYGTINVTQNIYGDQVSYADQQKAAARELRDMARRL